MPTKGHKHLEKSPPWSETTPETETQRQSYSYVDQPHSYKTCTPRPAQDTDLFTHTPTSRITEGTLESQKQTET